MHRQPRHQPNVLVSLAAIVVAALALPNTGYGQAADVQATDAVLRDYLSANGLLNRGMNDLAVQEYRKFLSAHDDHEKAPVARYGLGVALFRMKQHEQAIAELAKLKDVADFVYAAETQLLLGQSHLEVEDFVAAAAALQTLIDQHVEHELADDATALLAEALYRSKDYKSVQSRTDLLISKWPQSPLRERAEFFAALARMAQEDYAGAATTLAAIQERYPQGQFADRIALLLAQSLHRSNAPEQAMRQYQNVIKQGPGDQAADAMIGLAALLQQQEKAEEAGALLDQMLAQYPNHRLRGAALFQRGQVWFELKQYDRALETLQQAARAEGTPADEAAYWIAKCQMRRDEFAEAATRLAQAIKDFPQSELLAEMSYDHAVALLRSGDASGAAQTLASFRKTHANHALSPDALYLQAMIAHEGREYAAGREFCGTFREQYPSHELTASIAFLAAENDFLDEKLAPAAEQYRKFIAEYPQNDQVKTAKFRLGTALYRLEQFDEARQALMDVVDGRNTSEPHRRGLLMLGDIGFQGQQWPQAAQFLDDYLAFGLDQPSADDALLKRGLALVRQDRAQDGLQDFDRLLEQFPQSIHRVQALFERGQILLNDKDLDGASAAFTQVLSEADAARFAPYATNHLASIAMQREQFTQAADLFEQVARAANATDLQPEAMFQHGQALMAARQFEAAGQAYARMIQNHPVSNRIPVARAQQAIALARQGQPAEALGAIDEVEREFASKLPSDVLAAVLYEKAWCLRELERTEDAAKAYRDLLAAHERHPLAAHAMLELAEIESAAKRHKEAADLLTRLQILAAEGSLEVPPEVREPVLYRLAVAQHELGEHGKAAALCDEFIRQYPESKMLASAHLFCGESLFKLNKPQQAAEHFSQIIDKFPTDPACAPSLLRLGECHAAAQRWGDSEKVFATYLERHAGSDLWFQAQFGLGWACENQNRHDQAMAAYQKVIQKHTGPTAARAQFQIGECLFATKQYEDAVRELLKVDILYGYPEWSAAALYEAGRCFEELAKPAEARTQFQQVQEKYPNTQWAKLAAQRLTAMSNRAVSGG